MDFSKARFNMVEQQIRPWDVLDFELLDVLNEIPREYFVLPEQQNIAYTDCALKLANGGYMLEPKTIARLIQGLSLSGHERVLEVGTGSGYATAILAKLADTVITFDTDATQQQAAQNHLAQLGLENIEFCVGDGFATPSNPALYDAIYIGGSIPTLPQQLLHSLQDGGRLVVIIGEQNPMRAKQIVRQGNEFKESILFDTFAPALHSPLVAAKSHFQF